MTGAPEPRVTWWLLCRRGDDWALRPDEADYHTGGEVCALVEVVEDYKVLASGRVRRDRVTAYAHGVEDSEACLKVVDGVVVASTGDPTASGTDLPDWDPSTFDGWVRLP